MNLLITGSRAPVAILLARTLQSAGFTVYTADSLRPNFGQVSRAVTEDFLLPSPRFAPTECLAALARLATEKQLDAIIPTCEETFALSAGRAALPESVRLLCPPIEVLDTLHHKGRGIAFAAELGISTPETCASPDFQRDGILKRAYSRFSSHVIPLRGSEPQRHQAAATKPEDGAEWVWQEWIEGRALCTYSLCSAGEILAHAAYRTPYTVGLGAGIFYAAVDGAPYERSLAVARALAAATNYTGSLSLDFIEESSRRLVLIELNPRATMGVSLLTHQPAFGACWKALFPPAAETATPNNNLPASLGLATLRQAKGLIPPFPRREGGRGEARRGGRGAGGRQTLGVARHELGETHEPGEIQRGQGRRQLKAAMLLLGRRRNWRDVFTTPDVLADHHDPGPARAALRIYLAYAQKAHALRLSPSAFSTYDIEWNGTP